MNHPAFFHIAPLAMIASIIIGLSASRGLAQVAIDDQFGHEPSWQIPTSAEVHAQIDSWLDAVQPAAPLRAQAEALWAATVPADQVLQQTVAAISLVDDQARTLTKLCEHSHGPVKTPDFAWLVDGKTPALVRNNMRLWFGKWLAEERLYDEAMSQLDGLTPADVVDPAALLFYQSICHHWLLHKTEGLASINKLLEQRKAIPRRYQQLADLMQADLNDLEDDSLDHISRRMNDVARRLDYGHAGQKVRTEEDGIVASLDKMIQQLQDMANSRNANQQQQQGQGQDQQSGRRRVAADPQGEKSTAPARDSTAARAHGAGQVTSKNVGNKSGWGDLPPKDREEAMQQIGKEFPSHYRDVIEQYFRKLASEEEEK
ncbi:MAG TPA: hypothetical protein VGI75_10685 [Pirellulales bacterium]|jgi:hypothetical protein